jgi:hypothetical protein
MTDLLAPDTVIGGRYRIRRLLGRGGMGLVYEAEHTSLGRIVALKMLVPEAAQDAPAVGRFLQEARAAAAIGHPGIVEVFDLSQPGEAPFLAMERLEGEELSKFVARAQPIPPATVVALGIELCEAVGAAHKHGIVHRDLKPDNVFLATRGDRQQVKVLDFGIAKLMQKTDVALTQTGQVVGTPLYMSPEQMRNINVTARSDVYSIGAILYECLAGRPPFDGENLTEIIVKVTSDPVVPMRNIRADIPPALDALLSACLEKDPARRPADANALASMLKSVQQGVTPAPMYGIASALTPPPTAMPPGYAATNPAVPTAPMSPPFTGPLGPAPLMMGSAGYTPPPGGYTPPPVTYSPAPMYAPPPSQTSSGGGLGIGCMIAIGVGVISLLGLVVVAGGAAMFAINSPEPPDDPTSTTDPVRTPIGIPSLDVPDPPDRRPDPPPEPPPPEHELMLAKIGPIIQNCLNRYSQRAVSARDRYYAWCDRERGPTGQERYISYGTYAFGDETGEPCTNAVNSSNGLGPDDPELEAAATRYANAVAALAPTLGAAERYYDRESWRDDDMARGRELHASLVPQFDEMTAADDALRPLVRIREGRAREARVAALANDPARRTDYLHQSFVQQAQLVSMMMESVELRDGRFVPPDQPAFIAAIEELENRGQQIRGHTPTERLSGWSSYQDNADDLVTKALECMRAVRDGTTIRSVYRDMVGTSAGWMVDASPDAYIHEYNQFITFHANLR